MVEALLRLCTSLGFRLVGSLLTARFRKDPGVQQLQLLYVQKESFSQMMLQGAGPEIAP